MPGAHKKKDAAAATSCLTLGPVSHPCSAKTNATPQKMKDD